LHFKRLEKSSFVAICAGSLAQGGSAFANNLWITCA
jgi:hypothetical protein